MPSPFQRSLRLYPKARTSLPQLALDLHNYQSMHDLKRGNDPAFYFCYDGAELGHYN